MSHQSEATLEANLIKQLVSLNYEKVQVDDEAKLSANLKLQLEKHNKITLTQDEFKRVLNHLKKGNIFEKAKTLRDKYALRCDDGTVKYIEFLDCEHWCQNRFQVISQMSVNGVYQNRYDVTLLINGLPLVQIELKRRGLELKEAFNQINRYQSHSYGENDALFNYIQLFVISNGVNSKYYANNKKQTFKQTFYWADKENNKITNLEQFTDVFLERCHVSKIICKYIVLAEATKTLMVLRPYQYHATEAIIDKVTNSNKNGYIWHTTGSGKTLTSFKTAQVLMKLPKVHKVVFVVDRKDLDFQTTKEFNSFSDGSVDGTDNTKALVKQFSDDTKLIVTTIQKLNTAIHKSHYLEAMTPLKDKHIVFIFDECHRSQFGETHKRINAFFNNIQMIGFTGTPIFEKNATGNTLGKRTTTMLFDECLHKYVITDAINDDNVLKFAIEYVGSYKNKNENKVDIKVENIDTKELLESPARLEKIVDYIVAHHYRKTHSKEFTAMMCVSSVDVLIKYYELFKTKDHNLKIATIFSYGTNEDDKNANGLEFIDNEEDKKPINKHSREKLDEFIVDYNQMFNTNFSTKDTQSYYNYYNDISKKVKHKEIDLLLVVNMFLTGFDSKLLNTLYVDKNLKHHGLIQAFSRTNRILDEQKSQGNIVCFRNLKEQTDEAIALFSNKNAKDIILMAPYEKQVEGFNELVKRLREVTPDVESVNELADENEKLAFIRAFRDVLRAKNILDSFAEFKNEDVTIEEQEFEDYKSKYVDLKPDNNTDEKVSILDDVDFELELIQRDEVNVVYILQLLAKAQHQKKGKSLKEGKETNAIMQLMNNNIQLRSKKGLIEKFINENLQHVNSHNVEEAFDTFKHKEKEKAFNLLCSEQSLHEDKLQGVIDTYLYDQSTPLPDEIINTLKIKPKALARKKVIANVLNKLKIFIEEFHD